MLTLQQWRALREVINRNFTFADLSPKFKGVDSSTGNIFCPFHENYETPAAKMYFNEHKNIWVIHCFGECHRNFTAYDYVDLILCLKYQKYSSPMDFLRHNMPNTEIKKQLKQCEKLLASSESNMYAEKIDYINTISAQYDNISDYIEELYTS